jgi:hypothetical protein
MEVSLADLDKRDIARLRAELGEVIAARFAYPAFFDYRSGKLRVRPIAAARRQEIDRFVQAAILEPIARSDISSSDVRRYLEALFLRYLEVNGDLARGPARRRLSLLRVDVPRAAAEVQRGLVSLAAGAPGDFGAPRPTASWADTPARTARAEPSWERIQRDTELLQAALLRRGDERSAPQQTRDSSAALPTAPAPQPPPAAGRGAWAGVPMDGTASLPALTDLPGQTQSPFAGLGAGSQSALFGARPNLSLGEQPTGPLPIVGLGTVAPGAAGEAARDLSPDLLQLYGEYLRDMQPDAAAAPPRAPSDYERRAADRSGWAAPDAGAARPPTPEQAKTDVHVFAQLRYQLDAYIRLAARSYGVRARGSDPASAMDALRRSGHVDEADLRMAEGILALADRVVANGGATLDEYRQALMLYLLYHRGRLGA